MLTEPKRPQLEPAELHQLKWLLGTLLGLLIFGVIQSAIRFDGRLDPAWTRIIVGALLLAFILLQRLQPRRVPEGALLGAS